MREGYFQVRRRDGSDGEGGIAACIIIPSLCLSPVTAAARTSVTARDRGVERAMSTVLCMRGMRAACLNPGARRPRHEDGKRRPK